MSDTPPPQLNDDARRILDSVREEPIDELALKRVRNRVAIAVGVAAISPIPSPKSSAVGSSMTAKIVVLGSAAVLGVAAAVFLLSRSPNDNTSATPVASATTAVEPQPSVTVPAPVVVPPSVPEVASAPPAVASAIAPVVATQAPSKPSAPATAAVSIASAAPVDTLAAERALLAVAQQELSSKNYAKARETYEKHLAEYPHGVLHSEATVGRVLAMCGEKTPNATAEAEKLLATNPPSALAKRVRTACGIE